MLSLWHSFQETFKMSQWAQRGSPYSTDEQMTVATWSNTRFPQSTDLCAPGCHTACFQQASSSHVS